MGEIKVPLQSDIGWKKSSRAISLTTDAAAELLQVSPFSILVSRPITLQARAVDPPSPELEESSPPPPQAENNKQDKMEIDAKRRIIVQQINKGL